MIRIEDNYIVNPGQFMARVSKEHAREGAQILAELLADGSGAWHPINAHSPPEDIAIFTRGRTQQLDVFNRVDQGDEAYLLIIPAQPEQLSEKIEASLQALGALWRRSGIYEASVLYPPSKCAVIATKKGVERIALCRHLLDSMAKSSQPSVSKR